MTRTSRRPISVTRRALLRTAGLASVSGLVMLPGAATNYPNPSAGTGIVGRVIDLATIQPVAGALVQVDPAGVTSTSDQAGSFRLSLPPGTYTVRVSRDGYVGASRLGQVVPATGFLPLELDLVPARPTATEQAALYPRLIKQHQAPLPAPQSLTSPALRLASSGLPQYIVVYYDQANPPYQVSVPLEDYVKGVLPNEVFPSWPASTLQAQAVASRTYGVASFLANGYVYPDTRSQVYDPSNRSATTDAAVDATAGQVMTANGSVIYAFFFAQCNGVTTRNSENAITLIGGCPGQGFSYTSYCRARPCARNQPYPSGCLEYHGHGVGLCQWGAYGQGNVGASYRDILNSYYTGISITGGCAGSTLASATNEGSVASNQTGSFHVYLPIVANKGCL